MTDQQKRDDISAEMLEVAMTEAERIINEGGTPFTQVTIAYLEGMSKGALMAVDTAIEHLKNKH